MNEFYSLGADLCTETFALNSMMMHSKWTACFSPGKPINSALICAAVLPSERAFAVPVDMERGGSEKTRALTALEKQLGPCTGLSIGA
jgi:hypothetical protein